MLVNADVLNFYVLELGVLLYIIILRESKFLISSYFIYEFIRFLKKNSLIADYINLILYCNYSDIYYFSKYMLFVMVTLKKML